MSARWMILGAAFTASAAGACGGRPSYWDQNPPTPAAFYGLNAGVALVDDPAHRVVMVTAGADQTVSTTAFPVGHNIAKAVTSPDGQKLFVLSNGDQPRRTSSDESPSLTVVDPTTPEPRQYPISEGPLANLTIDPLGHWAVAYGTRAFVQNLNDLAIFDLTPQTATAPTQVTIRSFGGTPQRLTFTPELMLPSGVQRRFLVIETQIDVTLLELDTLGAPAPTQVTIRLTSGANAQQVTPAAVAIDGLDPNSADDARLALRAVGDSNVFTIKLDPPAAGSTDDFSPNLNITDVGGVPTDIAFVHTDAGLRVAALVPATSSAVLLEPDKSLTTPVALPANYSNLSLVTNVVASSTAGTDVALLWNAQASSVSGASGVALWTLGNTVGQPYVSVEALGVSKAIQTVDDVTGTRLKVLEASDASGFFVLDLVSRTAAPLQTMSRAALSIAPDGKRMWAFAQGETDLAAIDFTTLTPIPLTTDAPIDAVFDVARADKSGRSLIAVHRRGAVGATVFDALSPASTASPPRSVSALLLEGP